MRRFRHNRNRSAPGQIHFPPSSSASSRRQTPRRERRQFVSNVNVESEDYEPKRRSKTGDVRESARREGGLKGRKDQIYEEPVDAATTPPVRYRRSGSAGLGGSRDVAETRFSSSPRSPAARRAEAVKQATGLIYDPKVHRRGGQPQQRSAAMGHPNWRQYLLQGSPLGKMDTGVGEATASPSRIPQLPAFSSPSIASPQQQRKRF